MGAATGEANMHTPTPGLVCYSQDAPLRNPMHLGLDVMEVHVDDGDGLLGLLVFS